MRKLLFICLILQIFLKEELAAQSWQQVQKLVASDRAIDDNFGISVAINGEYAVVATQNDDEDALGGSPLTNSGSIYIFKLNGTTWTQYQKLTANDRASDVRFGSSMAMTGDYIVVGCNFDNMDASGANSLTSAGSAYIFKNTSGTWAQQQKIVASDRATSDRFAYSVDIDGSYIVIGAIQQNLNATGGASLSDAGAAYVFYQNSGTWSQQQKLVAFDRNSFDLLGWRGSGLLSIMCLFSKIYAFKLPQVKH